MFFLFSFLVIPAQAGIHFFFFCHWSFNGHWVFGHWPFSRHSSFSKGLPLRGLGGLAIFRAWPGPVDTVTAQLIWRM